MSSKAESLGPVLNFIIEAGLLKRVQRSGWSVVGVANPESVADHSFRCAVIAYFLCRGEGIDSGQAILMSLFNDICEARITDLHKMAQRYIDGKDAEDKAFDEQIASLPGPLKKELALMRSEYRKQESKASKIARDADILECLIQAKEYYELGNKLAKKFLIRAPKYLETKSARKLWQEAKDADFNLWWEKLSQFSR